MKAKEICKDVYWVGGIDWDLRNFHGYLTQRGSTYNAYLIVDEKVTLIDTVKHYLKEELLDRISSVIDPSKIDYIISNHVEMDHSGALPYMMEKCPNATIVTSPNGARGLKKHYGDNWDFLEVKTGDRLDIGRRTLDFLLTPMVHWPDNMLTYSGHDKILFSNDSFGQHIASSERFDDEYPADIIFEEARKYYANIVLPYSAQVQKELEAASALDIKIIAPSHGIIWRKGVEAIVKRYVRWSGNVTEKKALIIYDSMWGSTKKIAYAIQDGFEEKGYETRMMDLKSHHISDIMTEVISAEYICVGSPTLNNNILPTVSAFLTYLKGLAPKGRKGIAFGSYGWGGQSIGMVENELKSCSMEIKGTYKVNYIPDQKMLNGIKEEVKQSI